MESLSTIQNISREAQCNITDEITGYLGEIVTDDNSDPDWEIENAAAAIKYNQGLLAVPINIDPVSAEPGGRRLLQETASVANDTTASAINANVSTAKGNYTLMVDYILGVIELGFGGDLASYKSEVIARFNSSRNLYGICGVDDEDIFDCDGIVALNSRVLKCVICYNESSDPDCSSNIFNGITVDLFPPARRIAPGFVTYDLNGTNYTRNFVLPICKETLLATVLDDENGDLIRVSLDQMSNRYQASYEEFKDIQTNDNLLRSVVKRKYGAVYTASRVKLLHAIEIFGVDIRLTNGRFICQGRTCDICGQSR